MAYELSSLPEDVFVFKPSLVVSGLVNHDFGFRLHLFVINNLCLVKGCELHIRFIINRFQKMQEVMPGFHLMGREGRNCQEETLSEYA